MFKNTIFALSLLAGLTESPAILAADETPTTTAAAPAMPAEASNNAPKQAVTTQPANANHVDYRYCLELKTDREIIECRYKK